MLEASGAGSSLVEFRVAKLNLQTYSHDRSALILPLHTAYARIELLVPVASRGAFIPAGDTWNGYAAIVNLIQRECDDILVIDPYLSSDFVLEFLPHARAKSSVRCLTEKRGQLHPALEASARKWASEHPMMPFETRYAPTGTLHDRLIMLDRSETWIVTQSIKDIAKRSPASVSRAEAELSAMKIAHYESLWDASVVMASG